MSTRKSRTTREAAAADVRAADAEAYAAARADATQVRDVAQLSRRRTVRLALCADDARDQLRKATHAAVEAHAAADVAAARVAKAGADHTTIAAAREARAAAIAADAACAAATEHAAATEQAAGKAAVDEAVNRIAVQPAECCLALAACTAANNATMEANDAAADAAIAHATADVADARAAKPGADHAAKHDAREARAVANVAAREAANRDVAADVAWLVAMAAGDNAWSPKAREARTAAVAGSIGKVNCLRQPPSLAA